MSESLLVGSKTRAALKAHGVNVGGDSLNALNEVVHWYIDQAAKRAAANRRKTVRAYDFIIFAEEAAADSAEPAASQEDDVETAAVGSDQTESAVVDAVEAVEVVEEVAEEESPPAWSS